MGHQIRAGRETIAWTDGAWQVVYWCEQFCPRVKPAGMSDWEWADQLIGSTEITPEAAAIADQSVPRTYDEAVRQGLVRENIDEDGFNQCREFLAHAAAGRHRITGSY